MTGRARLENRRQHHVLEFDFRGASYRAGYSFFPRGGLAEIFLTTGKPNSEADIQANNAAILASLCLQHSIPLSAIRHSLLKADDGESADALGHALSLIDAAAYR